ncbi:MAG: phage terminase large subunit [Methanobrevibacter sp.]|jgi:hypothetical protein|nr:phage terminase large subunit [Methanobrevibacter sp.]
MIGGVTATTAYQNVVIPLLTMMDMLQYPYELKRFEWKLYIKSLSGHQQTIIIQGINTREAEGKIKGLTLYSALLDEVCELNYDGFKMLNSRLSLPGSFLLGTTNPSSPDHWVHKEYIDNKTLQITRHYKTIQTFYSSISNCKTM